MVIATFGPTTAWSGKTITREGDTFILEGHGPITSADVMEYDRQGHLVWANDGTRAWVGSRAHAFPGRSQEAGATIGEPSMPAAVESLPGASSPKSFPAVTHRTLAQPLVMVAGACIVVAIVAVVLAVTGVLGGRQLSGSTPTASNQPSTPAGGTSAGQPFSWAAKLAGTWTTTDSAAETVKWVFREAGSQATVSGTGADGRMFSYAFAGDTMTAHWLDGAPTTFSRQAPSAGSYTGTYSGTASRGPMTVAVNFSGKTFSIHFKDLTSGSGGSLVFTISDDGTTLSLYDSAPDSTAVYTRQ